MKKFLSSVLIVGLLFVGNSIISAEEMPMGEMTAEQQQIMAQMQAYGSMNENHTMMKKMVGSWTAEVKYWMAPGTEPQVSQGSAESKLIMGGLFLEQVYSGDMMGQPFEGKALMGYDNIQKEFQNIWIDSMSTGIMMSSGAYDADSKTIKEEGSFSCPLVNDTRWFRAVTKIIDDNTHTYETFMKDADGNEFQAMIITYTRN